MLKMQGVIGETPQALSELHVMLETFPPSFKSLSQWVSVGLAPKEGALPCLGRALSSVALI